MFDHEDMKAGLLQELIEKLMEMPEGQKEQGPEMGAMGDMDDLQGAGEKPDAKIAMMEIKKPGMGDEHGEPDEAEMQKPLGDGDFAMMRKKHLGL